MGQVGEQARDRARVRATVITIILVAGIVALVEAMLARESGSLGLALLSAGTLLFSLALIPPLRFNAAGHVGRAVAWTCFSILGVQTLYLIVYPKAYAAIAIASAVVVSLALTFVRGRILVAVTGAAWLVAAAGIMQGILGRGALAVPETADRPILLGTGLAAVTVVMVLLLQFARHMTGALEEARSANLNLAGAHAQLRGLEQMKSRFINTAAHELNTPLTPVMIQLNLLKLSKHVQDDAGALHSLLVLERNVNRINGLVGEMLQVARLQAGRLELHRGRFDVGDAVREAVTDFSALALRSGVTISFDAPSSLVLYGDPRRVAQVASNLVSNAVRHTRSGGSVHVSVGREGSEAVVRVADTGVGLTAEQIKGLFQPFSRVHDSPTGGEGTGLGLYICKGLVTEMGGRIWAESPGPGRGTTFTFTLPAGEPAGVPGTTASAVRA